MIELAEGRKYNKVALLAYTHTHINVVERNLKGFVKTVNFIPHLARKHYTRSGDSGHVVSINKSAHISGVVSVEVLEIVSCKGQKTDTDTCVLNGIVRVVKLSADSTDIGALSEHKHFLNPVRRDNLCVIVKKNNVITA